MTSKNRQTIPGPMHPGVCDADTDVAAFPVLALTRGVLRILGTIQNMLEATLDMLISGKHERVDDIMRMEEKVNTLFKAVRSYAVVLTRKGLDDTEQRRVSALLRYTASLENAGDVICKTMLGIPESMKKAGKQFSDEGKTELDRLFRFLIGTTQLSAEVIMAWHPDTAGVLVQRSDAMKAMCATVRGSIVQMRAELCLPCDGRLSSAPGPDFADASTG